MLTRLLPATLQRIVNSPEVWTSDGRDQCAYAGANAPRFIRGSKTVLGNHAFGTAFDINTAWNALGAQTARPAVCAT